MNYIVVPEGLKSDKSGSGSSYPSLIYRLVLDHVAEIATENDSIYLAPGNRFGGKFSEHEAARLYLKDKTLAQLVIVPIDDLQTGSYIDTRGNARYLREYLTSLSRWPANDAVLVVYWIHRLRAVSVFLQEGFHFASVSTVLRRISKKEPIVNRLWYYRYPAFHFFYELMAFPVFLIKLK